MFYKNRKGAEDRTGRDPRLLPCLRRTGRAGTQTSFFV